MLNANPSCAKEAPKQPFAQFPLALLAAGEDRFDQINLLMAYSTVHIGLAMEKKLGEEVVREQIESEDCDIDPKNEIHRAWFCARAINFSLAKKNPDALDEYHTRSVNFLSKWGSTSLVRVSDSLVIQVYDDEFDWELFTVLCGVYAAIGDKSYCRITRNQIRARAMGYASWKDLFDDDGKITPSGFRRLKDREDNVMPLTIDQVRYALDKLEDRKFFTRLQPKSHGREVFFSRSLNADELADSLFKQFERRVAARIERTNAEKNLHEKLSALL